MIEKFTRSEINSPFKIVTSEFKPSKIDSELLEMNIALLYDHHAYLIFERLNQVRFPRFDGINDRDLRMNVSKSF